MSGQRTKHRVTLLAALTSIALAGCGGSGSGKSTSSGSDGPAGSVVAKGGHPSPSCTPPTSSTPTAVVCPHADLVDGQTVHVYASGFRGVTTPIFGTMLAVAECLDKGDATGPDDCGTQHFVMPTNGSLSYTMTVDKVIGKTTCGQKWRCLVAVAQPKPKGAVEADVTLTFR